MNLEIRPVTRDAIDYVLANLSKPDRAEMAASGLKDPPEVFEQAAKSAAISGVVFIDEEPTAVMGCNAAPGVCGIGIPWMIATDRFASSGISGAHLSVKVISEMRSMFPLLTNWVHCEHSLAIRWLAWLGFSIDDAPVGPNGAFREFRMESKSV